MSSSVFASIVLLNLRANRTLLQEQFRTDSESWSVHAKHIDPGLLWKKSKYKLIQQETTKPLHLITHCTIECYSMKRSWPDTTFSCSDLGNSGRFCQGHRIIIMVQTSGENQLAIIAGRCSPPSWAKNSNLLRRSSCGSSKLEASRISIPAKRQSELYSRMKQ
jgi:hypothetical protein